MGAVLKYRLNGKVHELCAYGFKWAQLQGAEIIGGEEYFINKAVELGAVKPKPKAKKKD